MDDKIIVGLDIGTTKICVIVGRMNKYGKLRILGMGRASSDGVMRGIVTNIDKTVQSIKKALDEASEQSQIDIKVVNVGIAGQHIRSMTQHGSITKENSDDEISEEDVKRLSNDMYRTVTQPGDEIIHVMPQDYSIDYESGIIDPIGMTGVRLEADFHIITAQASAITNIKKCVFKAGLEIDNLILEPLASSLSVLGEDETESGVCLVDIGGGTTDIAIFHENIIRHTAVIPFGGNIITKDIKDGCKVMLNQAELLKTRFGKAIAEDTVEDKIISIPGLRNRANREISQYNLAKVIQARMEEIAEQVHNEILYSRYDKELTSGIVVTGGGGLLNNIKQLFEYTTGEETRIGYPNEHLGRSNVGDVKSPMYATAIGLVLSGFKALNFRDARYNLESLGIRPEKKKSIKIRTIFGNMLGNTKHLFIDLDDKKY